MIGEPIVTFKDNKLFLQFPTGKPIVIYPEELTTCWGEDGNLAQVTSERLILLLKYGIDILNDFIEDICDVDENGEPRENGDFIRMNVFTANNKTKTVFIDKKDLQIRQVTG